MQTGQIYKVDNDKFYEIKNVFGNVISAYQLDENLNKVKHKKAGVNELHKVVLFKIENHKFESLEITR